MYRFLSLIALGISCVDASMFHSYSNPKIWTEENIPAFDELFLTWNGNRPLQENYHFYVSVKLEDWSPEILYASWGKNLQSTFISRTPDESILGYQDALNVLKGKKATGFRIRVADDKGSPIDMNLALHVYTNAENAIDKDRSFDSSILLDVPGISQMQLDHPRNEELCSPTSTTAVIRYLSKNLSLDPLEFAQFSKDKEFDIFGNWVLNLVQASSELGPSWDLWVQRLENFGDIYERLLQNTPVIVSVRGPLQGSASPYAKGHLLAVIGYDVETSQVICMDPAFSKDEETRVRYGLSDFLEAWYRRGKIAYIFSRK